MIKKYNPKKIQGSWFAIQFLGYMDGSFIEVEFDEAQVTSHVGSQGDVSFILNANQMAKATVTLIQGSPTNDALSKQVPNALRNFMPFGDFQLTDLNGTTIATSKDALIEKVAKVEFSKTLTGRQWSFLLPQAIINVGGA